jgi:hypothetical protein
MCTEVTWIYNDEERKWYEGGEPDWSRLGEIVDREEAAAANGSNDKVLVTADEMEEHLLEKMKYREAVREQEQELLSDKRYNELEDEYEDDIVPWELRKRTFGAGGIDEDGKWQYGDGTYPYNPSPFAVRFHFLLFGADHIEQSPQCFPHVMHVRPHSLSYP